MAVALTWTIEKFKSGNEFYLTMRRDGQPEEGCQGKHDVLESPHALLIAADRRRFKLILRRCALDFECLIMSWQSRPVWALQLSGSE